MFQSKFRQLGMRVVRFTTQYPAKREMEVVRFTMRSTARREMEVVWFTMQSPAKRAMEGKNFVGDYNYQLT